MSEIYVTELATYPIKSCAPILSESVQITETGFKHDREWVITRPNTTFLSQRNSPELALIQPTITEDKLVLSAPSVGEFVLSLNEHGNEETDIEIFKKAGTGIDEGDEVADYLSDYLGRSVRLFKARQPRSIKPECRTTEASAITHFADGFQVLLTSEASLDALNTHSSSPIDMARFRPNIVVGGTDLEPYEEDYWRKITVGKQGAFYILRACARCPMPNIDQQTGVLPKPADRFVTEALKISRSGVDPLSGREEVFFGQNLSPKNDNLSIVKVGDNVVVDFSDKNPNFNPIS